MQARSQLRQRSHLVQSKGSRVPPQAWDPELQEFPTYEVRLPHWQRPALEAGWNRSYDVARVVFRKSPQGASIRRGLRQEFQALFGGAPQELADGPALLKWMNGGVRNHKRQVYCYVLTLDGVLRFVEAACMVSHACMAEAQESVCFAGEFHVRETAEGAELVLDNNSGTYAPHPEQLPELLTLLRAALPSLPVCVRDHTDPENAHWKAACKGEPTDAMVAKRAAPGARPPAPPGYGVPCRPRGPGGPLRAVPAWPFVGPTGYSSFGGAAPWHR